jgi:hypothetical protein
VIKPKEFLQKIDKAIKYGRNERRKKLKKIESPR